MTILSPDMSDNQVQIALSPLRSGETIIVPEIRGINGENPYLDFRLVLDELDLTVVAYFNWLRFITVGILYNGCPRAWNDLEDKARMRIRKAAKRRNISTEILRYDDCRYYILEGLEAA